jgi:hypothetical protein
MARVPVGEGDEPDPMTQLDELGHGPAHLLGIVRVRTEDDDPELALAALGESRIWRQHRTGCQQTHEGSEFGHRLRSYRQRSMQDKWRSLTPR